MSAKPSGSSGQPSASAIGRGMAITSGVSWKDTKSPAMAGVALRGEALVEDGAPGGRGGRPDDRARALALLVPPVGQQLGGAARRLRLHPGEGALAADLGVAVVEVLGQLGEQVELLGRHRQVGDDAVARVAEVGHAVVVLAAVVGLGAGRPRAAPARASTAGEPGESGAGHEVTSLQSECRAAITPGFSVGARSSSLARRPAVVLQRVAHVVGARAGRRRARRSTMATVAATGDLGLDGLDAPPVERVGDRGDRAGRASRCPGGWRGCRAGSGRPPADGSARLASQASNSPKRGSLAAKSVVPKNPAAADASTRRPDRESRGR